MLELALQQRITDFIGVLVNPTCKYELHLDDGAETMLMGHAVFMAVLDARAKNKGLFGNDPDQAHEPAGA